MSKIKVFIGCSQEAIEVAKAIQSHFVNGADIETHIYNGGIFPLGGGTLESLDSIVGEVDFAILVFSPDDTVKSRGVELPAPRDNVLLETGLFIGGLGRARTFVLQDTAQRMKFPSDLEGITIVGYNGGGKDMLVEIASACERMKSQMNRLGASESKRARQLERATAQVERFSGTVEKLVYLLAQSRVLEMDVIANSGLSGFLSKGEVNKVRADLQALQESIGSSLQE